MEDIRIDEIKLSHSRSVEYRNRDALIIVNEDNLNTELLTILKEYLFYFPETIYLENKYKEISGILTRRDVEHSIALNQLAVNRMFYRIDNISQITSEWLEIFYDKHQSVRCIPYILGNKLQGELMIHIGNENFADCMMWQNVSSVLKQILEQKGIKTISISDSIECLMLRKELNKVNGICCLTTDKAQYADAVIYGQAELKRLLRQQITDGVKNQQRYISLRELYVECLVYYCVHTLRKRNVNLYFFEAPNASKIQTWDENEKAWLKQATSLGKIADDDDLLEEIYHSNESRFYLKSHEYENAYYLDQGGYYQLADYQGIYLNIINGKRITLNPSKKYISSIHFFGSCIARGLCVSDEYTIESYIQKKLNSQFPDKFRAINYGVAGLTDNELIDFHYILNTEFNEGDIVICINNYGDATVDYLKKAGAICFETSHLFEHPNEYGRWFLDSVIHVNHIANNVISDYIFEKIIPDLGKERMEQARHFQLKLTDLNRQMPKDLEAYLHNIKKLYNDKFNRCGGENSVDRVVGAIVMNCNPFTYGHRYLIEQAAASVDELIVFVVQENKSIFPFEDRIELVRKGVVDLCNVLVLPSGRFMISTETFPEYFNKSQLQEISVDSSKDVRIFGRYIAPALQISKRFVGEEPMDAVTKSYNRTMHDILPEYGVEFIEIPRKEIDGNVISASLVRKLLKEHNFKEIAKLVPETTYQYLITTTIRAIK